MAKKCFTCNETACIIDDLLHLVALYDGKGSKFAEGVKTVYRRFFSSLGFRYKLNDTSVLLYDSNDELLIVYPR